MDQVKIGKFIFECRKNKNITQSELGEKLSVSKNAVSKWERGISLPDVSIMKDLCNILGISLNELFNGETSVSDDGLINYLENEKRKKKTRIIVFISTMILTIILSILTLFFINNYNKVRGYLLVGESENFSYGYNSNLLILSNIKNIASIGNIHIKNSKIKDTDIKEISLKYEDKLMMSGNYLNGVFYENSGYDEIFYEEARNNLDKWNIEVEYVINNEVKKEVIKLEAINILKNDNLMYHKVQNISDDTNTESDWREEEKKYLNSLREELLINHNFTGKIVGVNGVKKKSSTIIFKIFNKDEFILNTNNGYWRIENKELKELFSGNIKSKYIKYRNSDHIEFIYDRLTGKLERCNNRICKNIDKELLNKIKEFVQIYEKEFEGLFGLYPNESLEDPIVD